MAGRLVIPHYSRQNVVNFVAATLPLFSMALVWRLLILLF